MALIEIRKRCDDCERTRAAMQSLEREVADIRLDYQALYEKVRVNLSKLAKRAREDEKTNGPQIDDDPMEKARALLLQRKLNRG